MTSPYLKKLGRICRRLGGRLVLLPSRDAFCDVADAHRSLSMSLSSGSEPEYGIRWKKKIVYAVRHSDHIGYIIHEAGHVFADRFSPDHSKCNEWSWIGWEIAVARSIGAFREWSEQNHSYSVGEVSVGGGYEQKDWGDLSPRQRDEIAAERVAHAKKIGLLSKRGAPRSVR